MKKIIDFLIGLVATLSSIAIGYGLGTALGYLIMSVFGSNMTSIMILLGITIIIALCGPIYRLGNSIGDAIRSIIRNAKKEVEDSK